MDAKENSQPDATKNLTTVEPKSDCEIVVTRRFDAPAHIVFQAWTTPALFKRWWVPKSMPLSLLSYEADIRTGGSYRLVFDVDGSNTMAFFGKYLEVTPHSRIVWTNDESGEDGAVTTVTLHGEKGDKTLMVLHELYRTKEARDAGLASGAYDGMGETFDQLDEVLGSLNSRHGNTLEQLKPVLKRLQWSIDIAAVPSKVYQTLIGHESYAKWTSAFCEDLYFEGSWQEGQRIRFLTPSGDGVISEIAENRPNEFLSIRHIGYVVNGVEDTSSQNILAWAPAYENYTLTATLLGTKLIVEQDITEDFEAMPEAWPTALANLKNLCENSAQ